MTAAASGSLYICASLLGLIEKKDKDEKLPSALKEIKGKEKEPAKERIKIADRRAMRCAKREDRAKKWLAANGKLESIQIWVYYYLYALERCMTFRDLFEHRAEKEPEWYNDGAEFLLKSQNADGSWTCGDQCGVVPDTAFAVLFLMRSTKKAIETVEVLRQGHDDRRARHPQEHRPDRASQRQHRGQTAVGPRGKTVGRSSTSRTRRDFDNSVELLAAVAGRPG